MANRFENKVALITGGSSGIGFAVAKRLIKEGARVIITGRDSKTLELAKSKLGPQSDFVRADVSQLEDLDHLYAQVKARYGVIDTLFANAGIAKFDDIEAVRESDFDRLFNTNVKGLFFTIQKAIPLLAQGSAVLVNASVAGSKGAQGQAIYGATKAAARSFARTFSGEYLSRGIRFNVISLGPIETPIWDKVGEDISPAALEATLSAVKERNPMKRFGTQEEAASAAAFLLSPESSYIAGAELFVDGGYTQL